MQERGCYCNMFTEWHFFSGHIVLPVSSITCAIFACCKFPFFRSSGHMQGWLIILVIVAFGFSFSWRSCDNQWQLTWHCSFQLRFLRSVFLFIKSSYATYSVFFASFYFFLFFKDCPFLIFTLCTIHLWCVCLEKWIKVLITAAFIWVLMVL